MPSSWHQSALHHLHSSLKAYAAWHAPAWHVGSWLSFVGVYLGGPRWVVAPDIMVHAHVGPAMRHHMTLDGDGPPSLVIEVLEAPAWRFEADVAVGKGAFYHAIGVEEYLLFDPGADLLGVHCLGWRWWQGHAHLWQPDGRGRYWSRTLGVGFQPILDPYAVAADPTAGVVLGLLDGAGRPAVLSAERWRLSSREPKRR